MGVLKIYYTKEDKNGDRELDPVGGGLMSKTAFGYGYYEARLKLYDDQPGIHQAFWTGGPTAASNKYPEDFGYYADAAKDLVPFSNIAIEIDGLEFDSKFKPNEGFSNYHWWMPSHSKLEGARKDHDDSYVKVNQWLTVGFDWVPGKVTYYFDGVVRHEFSYDPKDPRFTPTEVLLTGLANTTWPWKPKANPGPDAAFRVDYFRFYTKPFYNTNYVGNFSFETDGRGSPFTNGWIVFDGIEDNFRTDGVDVGWDDGAR